MTDLWEVAIFSLRSSPLNVASAEDGNMTTHNCRRPTKRTTGATPTNKSARVRFYSFQSSSFALYL